MEFDFDEGQLELRSAAAEVLSKECPSTYLRSVVDEGHDPADLWRTLCALDWPGLAIAEAFGGVGASAVELGIVVEQLGYVGDPTPFLATTTQFAPVVAACGDEEQQRRFLGAVATEGRSGTVALSHAIEAHRDGDCWRLSGAASFVVDGDRVDEIAVPAPTDRGTEVFVVPAASVQARRTRAFDDALHVADVDLTGVVLDDDRRLAGPDPQGGLDRALDEAVVGLAMTAVGACQRGLDMTIEYVREREQFGVPIGSFQAVKHKIVDMFVAVERARALGTYASRVVDDDQQRPLAAAMAKAAAGDAQHIVFQHGIQLFGGIGFTWENDLHLYLRRAKVAELLFGGAAEHRARVASHVVDARDAAWSVQATFDEATEAFRSEFAAWLDAHVPDEEEATNVRPTSTAGPPPWARRWQQQLFDAGWVVPGNPPAFGGRDAGLLEQFVHQEELTRRHIVAGFNPQGLSIIAPSIVSFGTDEQKERWAIPILRGDMTAALGMSEPNAGSDLAGLRTRAVLDGDHFVVNGQKVWTSGAHDADVILAFVRTDPDAPKHKGISTLIIPTDTPGVTRRPFGSITGRDDLDFNEVFFDDVLVPAENLLGELHGGWRVANGSLGHERAMLWLGYSQRLDDFVESFRAVAISSPLGEDPRVRDWFATAAIDAQAVKLLGYRTLAQAQRGVESNALSILKLFSSEAVQRAVGNAIEALGPLALDDEVLAAPFNPFEFDAYNVSWFELYLRSFAGTIAGGTSEIQRNIIAERVLGLPR
ncbi:MAG: acyl-CoA dehydrogenase family protein [Acidimicrobiia bacterium]|nr:acyl-CoA dehydrogenase family protein [Acidimicrobiia bacterium]